MQNLTITPFTHNDLNAVLEAERICFEHPWTRDDFEAVLSVRGYRGFVAREAETLAGYAVAMVIADEATLANIATLPEHRGKGVAKALLAHALDDCRKRGASECFLEARESNAAARKLYASFGFTEVAVRKNYYEAPAEDAVIMKKELCE